MRALPSGPAVPPVSYRVPCNDAENRCPCAFGLVEQKKLSPQSQVQRD
jgi:hypothetical protein